VEKRAEFTRVRAALASSIHFRDLARDDLDRLAELGRVRRLRDGESAGRAGERRREIWIVLSGSMRMSSVTTAGREFVYAMLGPGGFYGIGSVLSEVVTTVDAYAAGPTSLIVMDGLALAALLDRRPWLWRHVVKLLHRRLTLAMTVVRDISVAPLEQRIARRLLGQAMSGGSDVSGDLTIELRVTQSDLGRMLGASRSKVNGELKRLEQHGLLRIGYRTITLADCARLRRIAGPDVFAF
jgi:CRP-like cAMP-binding protein